jgi:hypothetical protein
VGPVVKYTKTGDFNIAYQVLGDGPVDLLLLPGWITHLELQWIGFRDRGSFEMKGVPGERQLFAVD